MALEMLFVTDLRAALFLLRLAMCDSSASLVPVETAAFFYEDRCIAVVVGSSR